MRSEKEIRKKLGELLAQGVAGMKDDEIYAMGVNYGMIRALHWVLGKKEEGG